MRVQELIEHLQDFDKDLPVVLQCDSEGNRYLHLRGLDDDAKIVESDSYSLEIMTVKEAEDENFHNSLRCLILYP
jgi:hypothetical protein